MSKFVNLYKKGTTAYYRDILEYDANNRHLYVAGNYGSAAAGTLAKIDADGKVLWEKQYKWGQESSFYRNIVKCSNGDLLLYGGTPPGPPKRSRHLITRVNTNGQIVWSQWISFPTSRINIELVAGKTKDEFFIVGWNNTYSSVDDIEVIKYDGNGNLLASTIIGVQNRDDQIKTVLAHRDGCVIIGSSSQGTGWDGFVMYLDGNLNPVWKKLVGGSKHESFQDIVEIGTDLFALVGYSVTLKKHFVFKFQVSSSTHTVYHFDAGSDDRERTRIVRAPDKGFYVMSYAKSISASYIMKLDANLQQVWRKRLDLGEQYDLRRLHLDSSATGLIAVGRAQYGGALVMKTDLDMTSCKTVDLPLLSFASSTFTSKDWATDFKNDQYTGQSILMTVSNLQPTKNQLCPSTGIPVDENSFVQSPYLYLQAAGSDTTDGSSRGIHLRWDLQKRLGENHLPKGNLTSSYPSTTEYSRADDFVHIYRTPYTKQFSTDLDLQSIPSQIIDSGNVRRWVYSGIVVLPNMPREVTLTFVDVAEYDTVKAQVNPANDPYGFLFLYRGVVELRVTGQLFFETKFKGFKLVNGRDEVLRVETISWPDSTDENSRYLSCRKTYATNSKMGLPQEVCVRCENIDYLRFQTISLYTSKLSIVTYEDTILGYNQDPSLWTNLGDYSLTINDQEAAIRLEDSSKFVVDKAWGKYNEADQTTGAFTVKTANYLDRWEPTAAPSEGLKAGVISYLTLSDDDPLAIDVVTDPANSSATEVSYLDYLRLVSIDYHLARMMGLGMVDGMSVKQETEEFIYLAAYITEGALEEGGTPEYAVHFYMTLPTTQRDHRLPPSPVMEPVNYGLFFDNGTQTPSLLSDADGYVPFNDAPHGHVRYVNLHREPYDFEKPLEDFFETPREFCLCEASLPIMYGLEYRASTDPSSPYYRRPEILHDTEYSDHSGLPEVITIPESGDPDEPVYTHMEQEEGIHCYAFYAINWFSRISPNSNERCTDNTEFPKVNTLLPPSNFAIQLIQKEDPLIFTTGLEQYQLSQITGDKTLVRVTFEWNQIHNIAYQVGTEAEFFFRESQPLVTMGEVLNIIPLANHRVRVTTTSYQINSSNPAQTVQPFIASADINKYAGSLFMVGERAFQVESVTAGSNPEFILKEVRSTQAISPNNDGVYIVVEDYLSPDPGQRFIVYENLSSTASWDFKLNKTVSLQQFSPPYQETRLEDDGSTTILTIGGISQSVAIDDIEDPVTSDPSGAYTLTFTGNPLSAHPDPEVEWYRGTVRIMEDASNFPPTNDPDYRPPERKVLQVAKIEEVVGNLVLTVFDPSYDPQSSASNPLLDYMPIPNSGTINVNFHPGYRLYLTVDTNTINFDEPTILPGPDEGPKKTFMAIRSKDGTILPDPCHSPISSPSVLIAQEIIIPVPPSVPSGPLFATRPDFYGKATYTFDVEVDTAGRTPYALIFYRANERRLLDVLYTQDKVEEILNQLFVLYGEEDLYFTDRWRGLANVDHEANGLFPEYDGYRFPLPNNPSYVIPNADPSILDTPFVGSWDFNDTFTVRLYKNGPSTYEEEVRSMKEIVAEAIQSVFLPLTEQPILYKYVKGGRVTSNRKPILRDDNGDLIVPPSPPNYAIFDPYPMVVKYLEGGKDYVRFSDYTLDGSSRSFFFFFGVELSNTMEVSEASPLAGPIQLVNAAPAEQPEVKKVWTELSVAPEPNPVSVRFELNQFISSEKIRQFEVYRATSQVDALTVRTMELAQTIDAEEPLFDDFADLDFPPYGEPLYYRVVALREIVNEFSQTEFVPSKASNIVLTNVIDNFNPPTPVAGYISDPPTPSPVQLNNIQLSWPKTVHNGGYYLYKMNTKGNWIKIYEIFTNDDIINVDLDLDTDWPDGFLKKEDDDGNLIYHHFKVVAENASGLLSLEERILTI